MQRLGKTKFNLIRLILNRNIFTRLAILTSIVPAGKACNRIAIARATCCYNKMDFKSLLMLVRHVFSLLLAFLLVEHFLFS